MKKLLLLPLLFLFLTSDAQNELENCDENAIVCKARSLESSKYNLLKTDYGYVQVGPANSSFAHFYTNMTKYFFNKDIWSRNGGFSSYGTSNLFLKTHGTTRVTINAFNGYMGVGVSSPKKKLDVGGDAKIHDNLYLLGDAEIDGVANLGNDVNISGNTRMLSSARIKLNLTVEGNSYVDSVLTVRGDARLRQNLKVYNNVGIGTDILPEYSLAVCGKIRATEVKVDAASEWCDYVFEEDYDLKSLKEVDAFIKKNKHLPEIPSAEVVNNEGIEVSAMMVLMMKKIEELTLYTIEQEKRINELEKNK